MPKRGTSPEIVSECPADPILDPVSILYGSSRQTPRRDLLTPVGLLDELAAAGDDYGISFLEGIAILEATETIDSLNFDDVDKQVIGTVLRLNLRVGDENTPLDPEALLMALEHWLATARDTGAYKEALRYEGDMALLQAILTLRDCCEWSLRSIGTPWVRHAHALPDDIELAALVIEHGGWIRRCNTAINACKELYAAEIEQGRAI